MILAVSFLPLPLLTVMTAVPLATPVIRTAEPSSHTGVTVTTLELLDDHVSVSLQISSSEAAIICTAIPRVSERDRYTLYSLESVIHGSVPDVSAFALVRTTTSAVSLTAPLTAE